MRFFLTKQIGNSTVEWFDKVINMVKENKPKNVQICINNSGGTPHYNDFMEGQIIVLEKLTHLTAINMYRCDSAAFDLFLRFTNRKALDGTYFLIHNSKYCFEGDSSEHIQDLVQSHKANEHFWYSDFFKRCRENGMEQCEEAHMRNVLKGNGDYHITKNEATKWGILN